MDLSGMSEALRKRICEADLIIIGLMSGDRNLEAKAFWDLLHRIQRQKE